MELRVRVARVQPSGDVGDEWSDSEGWTESFADWITEDPRLARSVVVRRERVARDDGRMSSDWLPWISLAVDSGSFLIGLIGAFGTFRGALRREERGSAGLVLEQGGSRCVIYGESAEEAARAAVVLGIVPGPARGSGGDGDAS
ncbi:hypothetical protein [Streptomyces sp. NPDC046727]|uniref:effector-associated constant component EACC1 n=1 Tax=Streptomyces sp. NPDC046727 TaxID=3155373 RepID=UPI0033ED3D71